MKKLKIYTEKSWLPQGKNPVILLYPFWGKVAEPAGDPDNGRFDDYMRQGSDFFELADSPGQSDVLLLPFEYAVDTESRKVIDQVSHIAVKLQKKVLVFYNTDFSIPVEVKNSIVFRTSFYKSTQKKNEHAFPGWSRDFWTSYAQGPFQALKKESSPEISYCGYIDYLHRSELSLKQQIKKLVKGVPAGMYEVGPYLRGRAVRKLRKDKRIKTSFVIRKGFWAEGLSDKEAARKEYAGNMLQSPYALVARGAGNFSYRMYEVLSCGRIPVFINTDCVLPFDDTINWKKHCLWIEQKDLDTIAEKLLEFHQSTSEIMFSELQFSNRKLYEEMISPVGFFRNLALNKKLYE